MAYVPKLAYQLQTFDSLEEFNKQMNFHYYFIADKLTPSFDQVFHLMKKHSCKAIGVCWLKQETVATLLNLSIKTIERAIKFFKEQQIIKIYHTKRGNLNGNCYYVFQPCQKEIEEEIIEVEEAVVGAEEVVKTLDTNGFHSSETNNKLFTNANKNSVLNANKNTNIIYLSKIDEYINRHSSKICSKNIDTKDIYDAFHMGIVNDVSTFLVVLDRVIDTFTINFKRCLHTSLNKELHKVEMAATNNQQTRPIRTELLPDWFDKTEEPKSETLEELEKLYNELVSLSNNPVMKNNKYVYQKLEEVEVKLKKKREAKAKRLDVQEQLRILNSKSICNA